MDLSEAGAFHLIVVLAVAALFAAAVFKPQVIRSSNASWAAVLFVVLAYVGPRVLLSILAMDGSQSTLETAPIMMSMVSQLLLACALISTAIALFPNPQWEQLRSFFVNPTGRDSFQPRKPWNVRPENECLSCGKNIPAEVSECPNCGWTWGENFKSE